MAIFINNIFINSNNNNNCEAGEAGAGCPKQW